MRKLKKIGIIGVGWYGFRPQIKDLSFREMVFEAATRAYESASIDPRKDVDTFVSCQEDFWEGISIADEFAPDPIGGAMRPTMTVAGDGIQGIIHAAMQILSGVSNISVVEAHAKPSDIEDINKIIELGMDPLSRFPSNVNYVAGLDAVKFMKKYNLSREDLAEVVSRNLKSGFKSPRSSFASKISVDAVLSHEYVIYPLSSMDIAKYIDASIVFILASEEIARKYDPIWIEGMSFATAESLGEADYISIASKNACKMAGMNPSKMDGIFVDDRYSYKELEHLEALGISSKEFLRDDEPTVNPYGGHLAKGVPLEASGLSLLLDAVDFLNEGNEKALVASWRGIPTYTGAVLVMRK